MTIRSGGRPRDSARPAARPYDPDAYATDIDPRVLRARPARPRRRWRWAWRPRRRRAS